MKSTPVGTEIVERIAARDGVDPIDFDVLLYDVIDADALEALTGGTGDRQSRANLRVSFTYHGYAVTVDGNGEVSIDEHATEAETDELSRGGVVND